MLQPEYLKNGSKIGITCPSGFVSTERVAYSIQVLNKWGYDVKLGKTIGNGTNYFAGTDEERLADLQMMLNDPELDAILMGRGGYGVSRIIDKLDFTEFLKKPKWVCGFSDITVFHQHLQANYKICSLHSPMCGHFRLDTENEDFLLSFNKALRGEPLKYESPFSNQNRIGMAVGEIVGGNLSLITHLIGTDSEVSTADKILFLEDVDEQLYHIDRMMMQLKRAGKLSPLKGIIFGGFTGIRDTERPFGQSVEELLWDKVKEYSYPVCFHFPTGHQDINYTITLGAIHRLEVTQTGSILMKV